MFNFCFRRKDEIARLTKLAYYDTLTGLPNRVLFQEESAKLLKYSEDESEPLAVFLIDLDNFKNINDTHGHHVGDALLKQIAARIDAVRIARCGVAETVRKYNDHKCRCFASRLGGDEFVVMFEHMDKHEAELIAAQTIATLKEPVTIDDLEVTASASLGISLYPWDAETVSDLLKAADLAMYSAKEHGKDKFEFYKSSMNTKIELRVEAELLVRNMIETGNVELHFQPIFDVVSEQIVACEALLRGSKSGKTFHPTELIAVAEESNLIVPLGTAILKKATEFGCACLDAGFDVVVGVNVSSPQLVDPNFTRIITNTLAETGFPATNLVLEITETILISNFTTSAQTLSELQEMGIKISMDDFGKGYSSFDYLRVLPIKKIKIDMAFVQALGEDPKAAAIVRGIIEMADALGMDTCAEGVETKLQLLKLRELGCERAQGYYKSPALTPRQFLELLTHEKTVKVS